MSERSVHEGGGTIALDSRHAEYGGSVLVVDDEPSLLQMTARLLRAAGYSVTICTDGAAASRLIGTEAFDVVVSDIDMPQLSGIDLLKLLRERAIDVPVVLMTGAPTLESAILAVERGAFKYLTKPVQNEELLETVARAARSRAASGTQRRRESAGPSAPGASPSAGLCPGAVLGDRYRLRRLIGEGGMSQVWEAEQVLSGRLVALKLLHASLNARPEMRRRLLREARAAGSVSHPNVVDVFDVFELQDATPVLVMALLHGQTLGRLLAAAQGLTVEQAADLLLPVVSAVGTAHACGVVHRDLKPENIFLSEEGQRVVVKVLDFGIAKLVSPDERDGSVVTVTGAVIGTPGYMAPEQGFGERDVDHRADVWSIGAILYEALSGAPPIEADSVGQMLKVLMVDGFAPLVQKKPDLARDVASLVDRMLMRERDARPSDLREVYATLLRHGRVSAPAFGPPVPARTVLPEAPAHSNGPLAHAVTEHINPPPAAKRST
jgi:DNA-binding response OmpR family regulator